MVVGASPHAGTASIVPHRVATVGLAWFAMVGIDFFLHAGLLAPLYDWESPFLLRPEVAFVRIPIGYLSMLGMASLLAWLLPRLEVRRGRDGGAIAAGLGAIVWGALLLGIWSISTAPPVLLAGWWVAQIAELGLAGCIVGSLIRGLSVRASTWRVGGLILAAAVSAVALQAVGYATAPVIVR
jgi:hypothetical protein